MQLGFTTDPLFSLSEETEKARLLSHTLEKSFGDVVMAQTQQHAHRMKI